MAHTGNNNQNKNNEIKCNMEKFRFKNKEKNMG